MKTYFITVVVVLVAVLIAAWFVNGGVAFQAVALVCYGFVIGSGLLKQKKRSPSH
jgi:hypothetical protein